MKKTFIYSLGFARQSKMDASTQVIVIVHRYSENVRRADVEYKKLLDSWNQVNFKQYCKREGTH